MVTQLRYIWSNDSFTKIHSGVIVILYTYNILILLQVQMNGVTSLALD